MTEDMKRADPDETADDATAEAASSAAAPVGAPVSAAAIDGDATRFASEAELADLVRIRAAAPHRRRTLFTVVILLLVAFLAALVAVAFGRFEKAISWPGELDDSFDDARRLLRIDGETALLVFWPNAPENVVAGDGTNLIEVTTAVGRARDVPFHLVVRHGVLTNGLSVTTAASFLAWKRARMEEDWSFDVSRQKLVFLNSAESGYPAMSVDYARFAGGQSFGGRVLYIRHLEHEIVVLRELPLSEFGRAERLLDGYSCIAANLAAVQARFEIPPVRTPGDPEELLSRAYAEVHKNFSSSDWRRLDRTLRTVILSAREKGDARLYASARTLYMTFRFYLQTWYVRQCLAFADLDRAQNADLHAARASARTEIRRECASRLPDESDCRQQRVAQDDWSVR